MFYNGLIRASNYTLCKVYNIYTYTYMYTMYVIRIKCIQCVLYCYTNYYTMHKVTQKYN